MYLDTANLEEIKQAFKSGIFKGITTNPSILYKEGNPREAQIRAILKLNIPYIYVQTVGDTYEERLEDCKKICQLGENVGIKVPIDSIGLEVIKTIKATEPKRKILGTAIYSADQGILGALAGCDALAPYVNRMMNNDIDPFEAIKKIRQIIDDRGLKTEILSASFKNAGQVTKALLSGSHTATISYDIYLQMINKPLAAEAITVFNQHGRETEQWETRD